MEISDNAKIYNFNKELFTNEELLTIFTLLLNDFFEHMNDDDTNYVRIYVDSDYVPF